jgi:transcriptional regulator with XRE-family HTH domain
MSRLARVLKLYISVHDIDQKTLAGELNMSASSITRLLQGKGVDMNSLGNIIKWLTEDEEEAAA